MEKKKVLYLIDSKEWKNETLKYPSKAKVPENDCFYTVLEELSYHIVLNGDVRINCMHTHSAKALTQETESRMLLTLKKIFAMCGQLGLN